MKLEIDDSATIMTESEDDRPISLRRKRRSSSRLSVGEQEGRQRPIEEPTSVEVVAESSRTPTKPKKRVRFSDPGPDTTTTTTTTTSSTGLTPRLNKTFLSIEKGPRSPATPRLLQAKPRRQASLPTDLAASLPSPSLSPPTTPYMSGEFQFAPLRQILDDRSKRRLRRNNMSEEMNDIDASKKSKAALHEEVLQLKQELDEARQDDTGQIPLHEKSSRRVEELEDEIERLRGELGTRAATVEAPSVDTNGPSPATPESDVFCDEIDDENVAMSSSDMPAVLQDKTHEVLYNVSTDQTTQASLPSPGCAGVLRVARISLEHLFPGEISLGLDIADPKPILDTMLDRLQALKGQTIFAAENAKVLQTQEANMRHQFNAVLQQLERARGHAQVVSSQVHAERSRAERAEDTLARRERHFSGMADQNHAHEQELREKETSIKKLGDALETYRAEVKKLESLITVMEGDHSKALAQQRADLDDTVADLECHVTAETVGRREAEQLAAERLDQIKALEHRERDLRNTVHEKQAVLRQMETQMSQNDTHHENEVGQLNAQISILTSSLEAAEFELLQMQAEKNLLFKSINEERSAGVRAVENVQAELAASVHRADEIKNQYARDVQSRGEEVNEHKGLLTPVSACRFKNVDAEAKVEGHVEVKRGKAAKKRPDSGIGVLQEEMEEESFMV